MRNQGKLIWRKWLEMNQRHLIEKCGIPLSVLESNWSWEYFLGYGEYSSIQGSSVPDIDVETMPRKEAFNLCLFLEDDPNGDGIGKVVLNRLQSFFKRGRHADQSAPSDL